MKERRFKYQREDFGELPVTLHHLTIHVSFFQDRVDVSNCLDMTARVPLEHVRLDARELEILRVESVKVAGDVQGTPLSYEFLPDEAKLIVACPGVVQPGGRFLVRTLSRCFPSDTILEGIYRDKTPPGAPQQYMSQCQQWGFQRIMPIFDDCRAKCTMTTTLEGDAAYTHLISNGNVCRRTNPTGKPAYRAGETDRKVITFENPVPMAPYLFLAIAGTWEELSDEVAYPSGRRVRLEYLVPRGRIPDARIPMQILKDAVLWVHRAQSYEYPGETYRTICMDRSNFGGMENVGNTTIVTDAALVDPHTLDASLLYAHAVIVHEFEHNQCGSETTMETPFDVWLNEAYTVDVERRYLSERFDAAFTRLRQVDAVRDPLVGPLAIEDGGVSGRIVREGFNDPNELIDGVTYVKAAEVVRSLRLILGHERFRAGEQLYFSRYRNANADTDSFFRCFEEVSGMSLERFKQRWLYVIGYPRVQAETHYDEAARTFRVVFRQDTPEGVGFFHIPIQCALVDDQGRDLPGTGRVFELDRGQAELVFSNLEVSPAFASLNRDYSFYGTFHHVNASEKELRRQALKDPNTFNRVEAFRTLTDGQRVRLLHDPQAEVDPEWIDVYGELLREEPVGSSLRAYLLRIEEQPLDRRYAVWYPELVAARDRLLSAVNRAYRPELVSRFRSLDTYARASSLSGGIEDRFLKSVLLELIAIDDTSESHRLILEHFHAAGTANDRVSALTMLNRSSSPERLDVLHRVYREWHTHLSGYANYLRVVAGGTCPDVFDQIERERNRSTFDITQPTWVRALFLSMAANTRMIWTERGVSWLGDRVIELASLNTTTAARMLNAFQQVRRLRSPLREWVVPVLEHIVREVSDSGNPVIHRQARSYLEFL